MIVLLCNKIYSSKNSFGVIPWTSHGMTVVKQVYATMPRGNDIK
ncbi:hypothetical protein [Rickettsia asembonensis]|nr:hypothetical protein [Rickettsia asembonensis]